MARSPGSDPPRQGRTLPTADSDHSNRSPGDGKVNLIPRELPSVQLQNNDHPAHAKPRPGGSVVSRFALDSQLPVIGFAPAPKHAPGHFTNRNIGARVEGPDKQLSPVLNRLPPVFAQKDQQHIVRTVSGPSPTIEKTQAVQGSSFMQRSLNAVRPEEGTHEHATPRQQISFPTAQRQTTTSSMLGERRSPEGPLQQPNTPGQLNSDLDHTSNTIALPHNHAPERSSTSMSTTGLHRQMLPPHTGQRATATQHNPSTTARSPPGGDKNGTSWTTGDANARAGVPVGQSGTSAKVPATNKNPVQQPVVVSGKPDEVQLMRGHGVSRSAQQLEQHNHRQLDGSVRYDIPARERSVSLSGSSNGSGVGVTTSIRNNLNAYRDRDLPEVANKVNDLWKLCNGAVKDAERETQYKVQRYKQKLHDKSQRISRYLDTLGIQTQAIQQLDAEKQDLEHRIRTLEKELQGYAMTIPELETRCRGMKDSLDAALKEQQEQHQQHVAYKKSTEATIGEIRAEKQREQATREAVERKLDAVREKIKDQVRNVETESQDECRRLSGQLQQLRKELDEKVSQIKREKEINDCFAKQLSDHRKKQEAMEVHRSQTSDILKMLSEQQNSESLKQLRDAQIDNGTKLQDITKHLESIADMIRPSDELLKGVVQKHEEMLVNIMTTLRTMSGEQDQTKESLVAAVHELSKELQERYEEMQRQHRSGEATLAEELHKKSDKLDAANMMIFKKEKEKQIQAGEFQNEIKKLHAELKDRTMTVADLEKQLAVQAEHQKLYVAKEQASLAMKDEAVALERQKWELKLKQTQAEADERLRQAQAQINGLTRDNQEKASDMEAQQRSHSAAIQDLEQRLVESQAQVTDTVTMTEKLDNALLGLNLWAQGRAAAYEVAEDLELHWDSEAPDQAAQMTSYLDKVLAGIVAKLGNRTSEGELPESRAPLAMTALRQPTARASDAASPDSQVSTFIPNSFQDIQRGSLELDPHLSPGDPAVDPMFEPGTKRVNIETPVSGVMTPVPPTVEDERKQRRNGARPKSIVKDRRVTRSSTSPDHLKEPTLGTMPIKTSRPSRHRQHFGTHPGDDPYTNGDMENEDHMSSPQAGPESRLLVNLQLNPPSKRGRTTRNSMSSEPAAFFPAPGHTNTGRGPDEDIDDDDTPPAKRPRAKTPASHAPANPPAPARGKARVTRSRKQKPPVGPLNLPGVVQGALTPPQQSNLLTGTK